MLGPLHVAGFAALVLLAALSEAALARVALLATAVAAAGASSVWVFPLFVAASAVGAPPLPVLDAFRGLLCAVAGPLLHIVVGVQVTSTVAWWSAAAVEDLPDDGEDETPRTFAAKGTLLAVSAAMLAAAVSVVGASGAAGVPVWLLLAAFVAVAAASLAADGFVVTDLAALAAHVSLLVFEAVTGAPLLPEPLATAAYAAVSLWALLRCSVSPNLGVHHADPNTAGRVVIAIGASHVVANVLYGRCPIGAVAGVVPVGERWFLLSLQAGAAISTYLSLLLTGGIANQTTSAY